MWTNPNYGEPFSGSRKDTIVEDQQRKRPCNGETCQKTTKKIAKKLKKEREIWPCLLAYN